MHCARLEPRPMARSAPLGGAARGSAQRQNLVLLLYLKNFDLKLHPKLRLAILKPSVVEVELIRPQNSEKKILRAARPSMQNFTEVQF